MLNYKLSSQWNSRKHLNFTLKLYTSFKLQFEKMEDKSMLRLHLNYISLLVGLDILSKFDYCSSFCCATDNRVSKFEIILRHINLLVLRRILQQERARFLIEKNNHSTWKEQQKPHPTRTTKSSLFNLFVSVLCFLLEVFFLLLKQSDRRIICEMFFSYKIKFIHSSID